MEGGGGRFYLDFSLLTLGFPDHLPQISTIKVNILIEICEKSSYLFLDQEKNQEIHKNHKQSQKSQQVLISLDLGREVLGLHMVIETKSRNLNLNQDFSIVETKFWKCQDFLNCQDRLSASVESLDRDKSRPPGLHKT